MRHHAKGVTVITAGTEVPIGFCATSLASVSLDPPIVSFTVGLRATSWATSRPIFPAIRSHGQVRPPSPRRRQRPKGPVG